MACTSPLSKRSLPCQTGLVGCVVAFMLFLQVKPYQCVLFPQTTPEDLDCACDAPYSCSTQCLNKIVIPRPQAVHDLLHSGWQATAAYHWPSSILPVATSTAHAPKRMRLALCPG